MQEKEWKIWNHAGGAKPSNAIPTGNLSFAFIGKGDATMYFRSTSIMARDNIEIHYKLLPNCPRSVMSLTKCCNR